YDAAEYAKKVFTIDGIIKQRDHRMQGYAARTHQCSTDKIGPQNQIGQKQPDCTPAKMGRDSFQHRCSGYQLPAGKAFSDGILQKCADNNGPEYGGAKQAADNTSCGKIAGTDTGRSS